VEYYTTGFRQALQGANEIRRGFFGMNGRMGRGNGHTPVRQEEDEHELLEAQGYGLEPMARTGDATQRQRGLWG
jgi:hypothetical protein